MKSVTKEVQNLRANYNTLLLTSELVISKDLQNQLSSGLANALQELKQNTIYEEISCVSYHPENETLHATVVLKQNNGYNGSECSLGSREYVRFFVDYNRDGSWIDAGLTSFKSFDLNFENNLCYDVSLKIDPKVKKNCKSGAVVPRVRAILSWNSIPPEANPNFSPYWGNVKESNIIIEPYHPLFTYIPDLLIGNQFFEINKLLKTSQITLPQQAPNYKEKLEILLKNEVEPSRFAFKTFASQISTASLQPLELEYSLEDFNFDYGEILDFYLNPKFNTSYEELTCVSLNKDMSTLNATINIKRRAGYSGDLCEFGSYEYVAFYMDFGNGYEYMDTGKIEVNDIQDIPDEGLNYNLTVPVDLDTYRKEFCASGQAKLKGILSWNVAPPINQPNHVSIWGDWEECFVEIKSLPQGIELGERSLKIETLGSMFVEDINQTTGLASGEDPLGLNIQADNSPFDGRINFTGSLINAGGASVEYRILYSTDNGSNFYPVTNPITSEKIGFTGEETVTPNIDGWMRYVRFVGNLLGYFVPQQSGLHSVKIEARVIGSSTLFSFQETRFMVNKERPKIEFNIDPISPDDTDGNCDSFTVGSTITGTYSTQAQYPKGMSIGVIVNSSLSGGTPSINGGGSSKTYLSTVNSINENGVWSLDTSSMIACGYVIRMIVSERTIINSKAINRFSSEVQGFSLQ